MKVAIRRVRLIYWFLIHYLMLSKFLDQPICGRDNCIFVSLNFKLTRQKTGKLSGLSAHFNAGALRR